MKVSEFVKKYQTSFSNATESQISAFIKKHIAKTYIPYEAKISIASNIVKYTMYKEVNERKIFATNSALQYMFFVQSVIDNYTDLEWDKNEDGTTNITEGFNLLEENNLVGLICDVIGTDVDRLSTVIKLVVEDEMNNNRSIVGYLDSKYEAVAMVINTFIDAIDSPIIKDKLTEIISSNNAE